MYTLMRPFHGLTEGLESKYPRNGNYLRLLICLATLIKRNMSRLDRKEIERLAHFIDKREVKVERCTGREEFDRAILYREKIKSFIKMFPPRSH